MRVETDQNHNVWMMTKRELQLLIKGASKDDNRHNLNCVCFDAKGRAAVATNGHILVRCIVPGKPVAEKRAIIDRTDLEMVQKMAQPRDTITIAPNAKTAKVSVIGKKHEPFVQEVKLRDHDFPPHEQVAPNDPGGRTPVAPVGIDARYLSMAADVQAAAGNYGALKIYVGGECDPIVIHSTGGFEDNGRWEYVVMPMRLTGDDRT